MQFQTLSVDGDLVAFMGAATTNFADFGIYADVAGELVKVIAPGDRLAGKLVTRLYLGDEAVSDRSIAFLVGIEGGLRAIYRADLLRDPDDDGLFDSDDNCPSDFNPDQENSDGDGQGDACDPDDDNDGHDDAVDAFPLDAAEWLDTDGDGTCNNADTDDDDDGFTDVEEIDAGTDPLDLKDNPHARRIVLYLRVIQSTL